MYSAETHLTSAARDGRSEDEEMKGYKGFNKDFTCKGKQYAENTVFEEENAEICKSGMHFCANPFDVPAYYPIIDNNGDFNVKAQSRKGDRE